MNHETPLDGCCWLTSHRHRHPAPARKRHAARMRHGQQPVWRMGMAAPAARSTRAACVVISSRNAVPA
ncbi:hypothetical protein DLM_1530 [Aquitalea magnusonii]|uniref:Uncharacterized protein n=1 Tax=Aquitalea magnusonii TaxID=332411 RepID=A0A3G9GER9_9NEIS|nr:hypothetical protein DLM_1530 [Aquitalea magnusonii]